MMIVINHENKRKCKDCPYHKLIMGRLFPKHICVACDTKEAEDWGKTHKCPLE